MEEKEDMSPRKIILIAFSLFVVCLAIQERLNTMFTKMGNASLLSVICYRAYRLYYTMDLKLQNYKALCFPGRFPLIAPLEELPQFFWILHDSCVHKARFPARFQD